MEPEFVEGDVIIVNPHVEAVPGDFVIVKNDEEEATFKQLKKFGNLFVLHPLNRKYEDSELRKGGQEREEILKTGISPLRRGPGKKAEEVVI